MLYFIRQAEATASHLVTKCSQGNPHIRTRKMFSSVIRVERVADAIRFFVHFKLLEG